MGLDLVNAFLMISLYKLYGSNISELCSAAQEICKKHIAWIIEHEINPNLASIACTFSRSAVRDPVFRCASPLHRMVAVVKKGQTKGQVYRVGDEARSVGGLTKVRPRDLPQTFRDFVKCFHFSKKRLQRGDRKKRAPGV